MNLSVGIKYIHFDGVCCRKEVMYSYEMSCQENNKHTLNVIQFTKHKNLSPEFIQKGSVVKGKHIHTMNKIVCIMCNKYKLITKSF